MTVFCFCFVFITPPDREPHVVFGGLLSEFAQREGRKEGRNLVLLRQVNQDGCIKATQLRGTNGSASIDSLLCVGRTLGLKTSAC